MQSNPYLSRRLFLKRSTQLLAGLSFIPITHLLDKVTPPITSGRNTPGQISAETDPRSPFVLQVTEDDFHRYFIITGTQAHPFSGHLQLHALDCAIGAHTFVVECLYHGLFTPAEVEEQLLAYTLGPNGEVLFGNPDSHFRGNPDGTWGDTEDYGVNARAVAEAVNRFLHEHALPEGTQPVEAVPHYNYAYRSFLNGIINQAELDRQAEEETARVVQNVLSGYPTGLWHSMMGPPGMIRWANDEGKLSSTPQGPAWGVVIDRLHTNLIVGVSFDKEDDSLVGLFVRGSSSEGESDRPAAILPNPTGWKELDFMTLAIKPPETT